MTPRFRLQVFLSKTRARSLERQSWAECRGIIGPNIVPAHVCFPRPAVGCLDSSSPATAHRTESLITPADMASVDMYVYSPRLNVTAWPNTSFPLDASSPLPSSRALPAAIPSGAPPHPRLILPSLNASSTRTLAASQRTGQEEVRERSVSRLPSSAGVVI
jgi:hypothetical protein